MQIVKQNHKHDYDKEQFRVTKLPHLTKGLMSNYHYGFIIEHAKPVLEKVLIVNSLMGDIITACKQAAGKEVGPASFLVHVFNSKLNNLERA